MWTFSTAVYKTVPWKVNWRGSSQVSRWKKAGNPLHTDRWSTGSWWPPSESPGSCCLTCWWFPRIWCGCWCCCPWHTTPGCTRSTGGSMACCTGWHWPRWHCGATWPTSQVGLPMSSAASTFRGTTLLQKQACQTKVDDIKFYQKVVSITWKFCWRFEGTNRLLMSS